MKLSLAPLASVLAIAACAPPPAPMTPDPEPASEASTTSAALLARPVSHWKINAESVSTATLDSLAAAKALGFEKEGGAADNFCKERHTELTFTKGKNTYFVFIAAPPSPKDLSTCTNGTLAGHGYASDALVKVTDDEAGVTLGVMPGSKTASKAEAQKLFDALFAK